MLASDSRVLLMDFGLVREEAESSLTRRDQMVGTPAFMSPEQCRGEVLDHRTDIFSLGSTIYYLLTKEFPFSGKPREIVDRIASGEVPVPVCELNPAVPPALQAVVQQAMANNLRDRFRTAAAMGAELKTLLRGEKTRVAKSGRSVEIPPASIETCPVDEIEPIELLPLETRLEWAREKLPAFAIGGIVLAAIVVAGLILNFCLSPDKNGKQTDGPPLIPDGMVYIEAGWARLGNDETRVRKFLSQHLNGNELDKAVTMCCREPQGRVQVPAFLIDQYEVTNLQYDRFIKQTNRAPPEHWKGKGMPRDKQDDPVVGIRYEDAEAYARSVGKNLPTREQWMRAYRGNSDSLFPWGDEYDAGRINVRENQAFTTTCSIYDTPQDVSPFKVYNMVGNVSEFIRGWTSFKNEQCRVSKGADYNSLGYLYGIGSCDTYYQARATDLGTGFRCVREIPVESPGK